MNASTSKRPTTNGSDPRDIEEAVLRKAANTLRVLLLVPDSEVDDVVGLIPEATYERLVEVAIKLRDHEKTMQAKDTSP